jgi:putative redox protein
MDRIRLRRSGPRQLVGIDERNHTLVLDTKPDVGGEGAGLKPSELLPFSIAACISVTLIGILEKQRQGPFQMTVDVEFEQSEELPKAFTQILLHWQFTGQNLDLEKIERAVETAEQRYCSVTASLKDSVKIAHRVTIAGQ